MQLYKCVKFYQNISNGFGVIERTRFVTDILKRAFRFAIGPYIDYSCTLKSISLGYQCFDYGRGPSITHNWICYV